MFVGILVGAIASFSVFQVIRSLHQDELDEEARELAHDIQNHFNAWETVARGTGSLWVEAALDNSRLSRHLERIQMLRHFPGFQLLLITARSPESGQPFIMLGQRDGAGDELHSLLLEQPQIVEATHRSHRESAFTVNAPFRHEMSHCEGELALLSWPIPGDLGAAVPHGATVHSAVCLGSFIGSLLPAQEAPRLSISLTQGEDLLFERLAPRPFPSISLWSGRHDLEVGEGTWTLTYATALPLASWQLGLPLFILLGFTGVGILLYGLIASEARARFLAEEMIESFRGSLKRSGLLAEMSELLATQRDTRQVLDRLARMGIPLLGPGCGICVLEDERNVRIVIAHAVPQVEDSLRETFSNEPLSLPGFGSLLLEMEERNQLRIPEALFESRLVAAAPAHLQAQIRAALRWCVIVPMVARGQAIGALVVRMEHGRRYGPRDFGLIQDVATRIAMALDNTYLLQRNARAIQARDEFLSIASHELLTPLTALKAHIQALVRLQQRGKEIPEERFKRAIEVADRQIQRLANLINELLDVSRIESGKMTLERQPFDLSALVVELASRYDAEAAREGCSIEVVTPGEVAGEWDRFRLEQVLTNLLSNAIKYGGSHPITVTVEADAAVARVSIRDRGMGIDEEWHHRIFRRFERAVASGGIGGLGLGLYIAKQIVETHGGTLGVASARGQGSTFTMSLPRRTPDGARERREPDAAPGPGH